jgi:hypothetical protein
MESLKQFKEQGLKDKQLINRLRSRSTRVKDVEREWIWAIALAHTEGLSIRKIAKATGLSSICIKRILFILQS